MLGEDEISDLVGLARSGDRAAWNRIVDEFAGVVWATARRFRLSDAQAADAAQTTWLRLVEHLDAIEDPTRLAGWLATTCRRICLSTIRDSARERLVDFCDARDERALGRARAVEDGPERTVVHQEEIRMVRIALDSLGDRDRELLTMLADPEQPSYQTISTKLSMPIGSIGPTRARALARLRAVLVDAELLDIAN